MNMHVFCEHDHETGPPIAFTPTEFDLCGKYFDYPHLVERALNGETEATIELDLNLNHLAKDAGYEHDAYKLLALLAETYHYPRAIELLQELGKNT